MTKVLFATHDGADYLASCLWDGLKDVLGAENVYDAGNNGDFHTLYYGKDQVTCSPNHYICGANLGPHLIEYDGLFDLLVLNACFRSQYPDWHWPWQLRQRLKPGGKVAFVEGGDQAWDINDPAERSRPPFPVDAVFRREIDPTLGYPYQCHHLDFAAPGRWVEKTRQQLHEERPIDVFYAGGPSNRIRRQMMQHVFNGHTNFSYVFSQQALVYHFNSEDYFALLRRSKLALCPPGGEGCSSTMKIFETLACGSIPIYVCHPRRYRSPPYPGHWCDSLEVLPKLIDDLLARPDLENMRLEMLDEMYAEHTTAARAHKLLETVGL